MTMSGKRFLAIDHGNSFFKLSLLSDGCLEEECRIPSASAEEIFACLEHLNPDCATFCSVGRLDSRLVESLRRALDGNLLILSHSTPLPIAIEYATPSTLGLDRIALAAGAASLFEGECVAVADAGTALTIDVVGVRPGRDGVASEPVFLGGRISPGVRLRFNSLHDYTATLPQVYADGHTPLTGDSTETSIRSGVVRGLADEIVETFRQYKEHHGCIRLLLTGGDAPMLFNLLSSRIPAVLEADLMAKGLHYIYNYNEI